MFNVTFGLMGVSGSVYFKLMMMMMMMLMVMMVVWGSMAGKQAPLQAWEAGSREAGWGCLARPLMEEDEPERH